MPSHAAAKNMPCPASSHWNQSAFAAASYLTPQMANDNNNWEAWLPACLSPGQVIGGSHVFTAASAAFFTTGVVVGSQPPCLL